MSGHAHSCQNEIAFHDRPYPGADLVEVHHVDWPPQLVLKIHLQAAKVEKTRMTDYGVHDIYVAVGSRISPSDRSDHANQIQT
jgi:hypothetical protein